MLNAGLIVLDKGNLFSIEKITNGIFQRKDCIVVQSTNKSFALNNGLDFIKNEKKDFVVFMESDERLDKDYLIEAEKIFQRYSLAGIVYTDFFLNEKRKYLPYFSRAKIIDGFVLPLNCTCDVRKIMKFEGFDTKIEEFQIWDAWIQLSELTLPYHIPKALYSKNKEHIRGLPKLDDEKVKEYTKYIMTKTEYRNKNGRK